jgi:hypothetical protein
MTREKESALLDFCHRQRGRFDEQAWQVFSGVSAQEMATVASYLAGVAWYGNQEALRRVAARLQSGDVRSFPELARDARFEPSRFAGLLKARAHARAS